MATNTVTTSGLATIAPEIAPYYTGAGISGAGLLPKAQEIYSKDYVSSVGNQLTASGLAGAGRVAGMSDMQTAIGTELAGMQSPGQFAQGTQSVGQAQDMYNNLPNVSANTLQQYQLGAGNNINANQLQQYQVGAGNNVTADQLQQYQLDPSQAFGQSQAQQYMSPYQQNVTDYAKDQALRDAQIRSVAQNLGSARQGTYGGARNLLAQTELDRNLQSQMQGIQYKGSQDAYTNAQQQFERDRASGYQTSLANQQASLGVQQLGSAQSLQAQLANQASQQARDFANQQASLGVQQLGSGQSLDAQRANQAAQQSRDLANQQAQLGVQQLGSAQSLEAQRANQAAQLQAAAGLTNAGQAFGQLGTAQQATDIDRIKTQGAYGDLQRAVSQQGIDARYQDLLQQINYPKEQLAGLQGILTGVPVANQSSTQTTQTPSPSFASQLTGAGLTGLGLYNMFSGKS